jgi:FkbM family methyltransferase
LGGYLLNNRIKLLKNNDIQILLDVGGNTGQFAYYTRNAGYRNQIISFEPLSSAYSLLVAFAKNDPKWQTVNAAIGDMDGEIEINVSANLQSSSILDMMPDHVKSAPESAYTGKEKVKIHKLDTIIDQYSDNLDKTFLKIDTQGFEKNVLEGAERCLQSIKGLQLELSMVELYKGETLFNEMLNYIIKKGFTVYSLEPGFYDKKTGQLLQVDAIFYRR